MGRIKVRGEAKREVHPDMMMVEIKFKAEEKRSSYATSLVVEQCDRFIERITAAGLDKNLITLDDSANSTIEPFYGDDSDNVRAERGIRIGLPYDAKILNDIIYVLNDEDLNFRYEVSYEISNKEQIEHELLVEAVKDSKAQAEVIAASLSIELAGVKEICSDDMNVGDFLFQESERSAFLKCEREWSASDDLQSAEQKLSKSVMVIWNVK